MAKKKSIQESFWEEEFNGTRGYEVVNQRMKDGIETCKNLAGVIRIRAKNEDDFAKSLQKNFKPSDCNFNSETGKLRDALDSFRLSGEKIAMEHQAANKELNDCADRIQKYCDKLRFDFQEEKGKAKKSIQEKQRQYDRAMAAKRAYHEKSRAAEQAEVALKFIGKDPQPNILEKHVKARDKTRSEADKAEQMCREAIHQLNEARLQWEKDLYRYYEFCEGREKDRITTLQNELWIVCNIGSTTYVAADDFCEEIRCSLQKVSPDAEINEFVEKNHTGAKRPAAIPFEKYVNVIPGNTGSQNGSVGMRN